MTPDPERLGGLGWLRRTDGALTAADRRRLIPALLRANGANMLGRARLLAGLRPSGIALPPPPLDPPDSRVARAAELACTRLGPALAAHSYRTWLFGHLLAAADRVVLPREEFYVAALCHDIGLSAPVPGEDFTVRSADAVLDCGAGEDVADAVAVHTLPGIGVPTDGELGTYLQAGAMLDLVDLRAWDLPAGPIAAVRRAFPDDGLGPAILAAVKAESAAVPGGRFALISRWGFPLAVRLAHPR